MAKRTHPSTHSLGPQSRARFLKIPSKLGDHSDHPWTRAFGSDSAYATCACCGAGIKRAVITPATAEHPEGQVMGLDCYARAFPVEGKAVRKRLSDSKKAAESWEHAIAENTMRSPRAMMAIADQKGLWDNAEWQAGFRARLDGCIARGREALLLDKRLDDCDRADLLARLDADIAEAKRRLERARVAARQG